MPAAVQLSFQFHFPVRYVGQAVLPDIQAPHAFRPVEFMGRKRQKVNPGGIYVDGEFAHGLGGISHKQGTRFVGQPGHVGNGLNHAGFVVDPHHGHQQRIGPEGSAEVGQIDQARARYVVGPHGQVRYGESPRFEVPAHVEHGFVFGLHRDDVPLLGPIPFGYSFDSQVNGLSGTRRKYQFVRVAR